MDEQEKIRRGRLIAKVLNLKLHYAYAEDEEKTRYHTAWGDKTALGLYETVNRLLTDENIDNMEKY
jgi:hypothetical protein